MTPTPHDALVRAIFGQPQHAAAELRAVLPAEVLAELDLSTLAPVEGSFIDEALRPSCADLLFTVNLMTSPDHVSSSGRTAFAHLLIEHQSTPDRRMPLRFLRYQTRIWEKYSAEHPSAIDATATLPPIVTVLLHHGPKPWPWPANFASQIAIDAGSRAALGPRLLDFEFVLDDLATQSDAKLLGRAMDAISKLTLIALRNSRCVPDLATHLAAVLRSLHDDLRGPAVVPALAMLMRYVLEVSESPPRVVRDTFTAALAPQIRSDVMTSADMLRAEGRVEGQLEGRIEAHRERLLELLEIKFGPVVPAIRERIGAAPLDQLVQWMRRFAIAPSLDAVFAD